MDLYLHSAKVAAVIELPRDGVIKSEIKQCSQPDLLCFKVSQSELVFQNLKTYLRHYFPINKSETD